MNVFEKVEVLFEQALREMPFWSDKENLLPITIKLETPRDRAHGDMASNIAMTLAKSVGKAPRDLADEHHGIFINLRLGGYIYAQTMLIFCLHCK